MNDAFLNNAFSKDEQNAIKKTLVVNENNLEYGTNGGVDTTDKVYFYQLRKPVIAHMDLIVSFMKIVKPEWQ